MSSTLEDIRELRRQFRVAQAKRLGDELAAGSRHSPSAYHPKGDEDSTFAAGIINHPEPEGTREALEDLNERYNARNDRATLGMAGPAKAHRITREEARLVRAVAPGIAKGVRDPETAPMAFSQPAPAGPGATPSPQVSQQRGREIDLSQDADLSGFDAQAQRIGKEADILAWQQGYVDPDRGFTGASGDPARRLIEGR